MKNQDISHTTLLQDRNLNTAAFQPRPARFSTEVEGEGMEVFLRGLLVACLVAALAICNLHITTGHDESSTLPSHNTAVATTQQATAPVAEAL